MNIKQLIGAVSVLALVGCASNSPVTKQEIAVQESIDNLPEWYVDLPKAEEGDDVLYVAGTGKSGMLMLANKLSAKVSSRFKQYIREVGAGTPLTIQDNEQVVKKLVTEANVAGYINEESAVMREGTYYRVYVLASYPIEENTLRAIAQTEAMIKKFGGDKDKAFKELDREIDANREGGQATYKTPVADDVVVYEDGITETVTAGYAYDPTQSTQ